MPELRQTPRSLAALAVAFAAALIVPGSGCSSTDLASGDYEQSDDAGVEGDGDGDPTGDPTGSNTGTEGEGDGDGDGDDDGGMPTPQDPGIEVGQCAADSELSIAYDLEDAQHELAPALVREAVLAGPGAVPNIPLGVQPFLNYFDFKYPPSDSPELQISGELWKPQAANADAPTRYRLQYAIRGPYMSPEQRLPVDLAIVVDLGPAMAGETLGLAEEALAAIEAALIPGDRVTLIAAAEEPQIIAESEVIANFGLTPLTGLLVEQESATAANIGAALTVAYETVGPDWQGQGQPRVLLLSNGHFNLDAGMLEAVDEHAAAGHYLVTLGLGAPELLADGPLRQLAAEGRGPLLYDRNAEQVWIDMQERFTAHMIAIASDLEVRLSLPPGLGIRVRDLQIAPPTEADLGLLGANDMLVFHHELETCAELDPEATIRVEAEWYDPIDQQAKAMVWEQPVGQPGFGSVDTRKGAAGVAYALALRGYRDGTAPSEGFAAVLDAISLIAEALEALPEDPDLVEMSQVLGKLGG